MNSILYDSLEKATNEAIESGDQVVSIECPCCHKIFYTTKIKAAYALVNRVPEDFSFDRARISLKQLGEICPHCGFAAELSAGELFKFNNTFVYKEIKAEQKADEIREANQSSWAKICNPIINFKEVDKDD